MKNEKFKAGLYSAIITLLICVLVFMWFIYPNMSKPPQGSSDNYNSHFNEIQKYIDKYSIFDFDNSKAFQNASYGYLYGLKDDGYIGYFSKDEYTEYISGNEGNFTGIGIQFYYSSGTLEEGLLIWRVLGDSPAEIAGVKPGDLLTAVDGESIKEKSYTEVLEILQGEEGENSDLTVNRSDESLTFSLKRSKFIKRDISYYLTDKYIGVVSIDEFTENVYSQFKNAIEKLAAEGAKGIIFDLRNNPGGNLDTVCDVVDLLVPAGSEIAIIEYKDTSETIYAKKDPIIDLPYVVLTNRSSASAAELFSSALRDLLGSPLVGEKTYGKGVGQQTFSLSDGSAIKLTTFKYYTKSRTDYNNIGLVPDYNVEMNLSEYKNFYSMKDSEDSQKQKAKEVLQTLISEKGNR
ncbi:MAG: hypothetical protein DBX47_07395 [Clostridiales bacterium]|nr:MAG: hypothetical protein DBX47_07395 [Clostridiales bacterium]